jgi:hypothetical protein
MGTKGVWIFRIDDPFLANDFDAVLPPAYYPGK